MGDIEIGCCSRLREAILLRLQQLLCCLFAWLATWKRVLFRTGHTLTGDQFQNSLHQIEKQKHETEHAGVQLGNVHAVLIVWSGRRWGEKWLLLQL